MKEKNIFELANQINIVDVVEHFTDLKLVLKGDKTNLTYCPICMRGHKTPCFSLYSSNGKDINRYKCFSCESQGDSIKFVQELKHIDSVSAAEKICDEFHIEYDSFESNSEYKTYTSIMNKVADVFNNKLSKAPDPDYFIKRGFSASLVFNYSLGYCPAIFIGTSGRALTLKEVIRNYFPSVTDSELESLGILDKYGGCILSERYIVPIKDKHNNVIAFSGRTTKEVNAKNPKYKNSLTTKFFNKKYTLFNWYVAKSSPDIIVVEGYMDALSLVNVGINNVVAAMGTAFDNTHLSVLKGKNIILSFDNDNAGKSNMYRLITHHKDTFFNTICLSKYKDFNDALMSGEDIKSFILDRKNKITGPEFLIRYLVSISDLSLLDDRRNLWLELSKLIGADSSKYQGVYPINTIYTPLDFDYYWTIVVRLVKGKRNGVK